MMEYVEWLLQQRFRRLPVMRDREALAAARCLHKYASRVSPPEVLLKAAQSILDLLLKTSQRYLKFLERRSSVPGSLTS